MSNSNGTSYTARSMNGIITIDDGAGTTIENGTIITDDFTVNNFTATNAIMSGSITCNIINGLNDLTLANICTLFNNEVNGIIYIGCANTTFIYIGYNTNIYKVLYLGSHASDIFLGGFKFLNNDMNMADDMQDMNIANTQYTGNLNIGTYVYRSGQIKIGNISNTNIIGDIKIISNAINLDVNADFIIGDELLNFNTLYLGNLVNRNVIGGLLVVDNVLDTNIGTSILNIGSTNATTINMGSSTSTTYIKNSRNLIIGQTPETYNPYNSLAGRGVNINTGNNATIIEMYSSLQAGQNYPSSRIYSYGGTDSTNSGELTISSGTIKIEPIGNLTLGMASSINTFIQNSNGLIIGQSPTDYSPADGFMTGSGMVFKNITNNSILDFHSTISSGRQSYTGRIAVATGTTQDTGTMTMTAKTIDITPTGSATIGSGSTVNNYIRNTTNLIIGANPSTYATVGNTLAGNGASIYTKDNYSIFDMYSSGNAGQNNTSSRIYSYGGTSVANSGALTLSSGTINLTAVNTVDIQDLRFVGGQLYPKTSQTLYLGNANCPSINIGGGLGITSNIDIGVVGTTTTTINGTITLGNATNTNTIGGIRVVGNVLDLKASGTLTIGSATTPSINIGSTTTRTYIQSVDIIAIGQLPSTFDMPTQTMTGGGTVIGADGIGPYQAYIDLYSFNGTAQTKAARIASNPSGLAITNYITATPLTITGSQNIVLTASSGDISLTASSTVNITSSGGTIALSPSGNLTMGSATSVNTFIRNSNGLIIGKNPSTYLPSDGKMTGEGVRFTNDTNTSLIDFHSTTLTGQQDYTGRVMVQNGTSVNSGAMQITSGSINITSYNSNLVLTSPLGNGIYSTGGTHNFQSGMCYSKGNLTSAFFTQTYSSGMIGPAIPGSTVCPTSLSYTFPTAFSTTPVITLSTKNNTLNGASWGIILSVAGVSTTGVVLVAYNAKNSAVVVNSWGYNIIAVGGW